MNPIVVPESFNYIGVFLTFNCQLNCSYCINNHNGRPTRRKQLSGNEWIQGLRRLQTSLPLTFQGGEPTMHAGFYHIVNNLKEYDKDVLTNLEVSTATFMRRTYPHVFKRDAKYASIRVSYHHGQNNFYILTRKVLELQKAGYSIGIWEVDHPDYHPYVMRRKRAAEMLGIDYRTKEFLGLLRGKIYGTMKYEGAVGAIIPRRCTCTPSELLIGPGGDIYRCHSELYAGRDALHNIMDEHVENLGKSWRCEFYGKCNPCDIKVKNDRYQVMGHTSVEIKNVAKLQ